MSYKVKNVNKTMMLSENNLNQAGMATIKRLLKCPMIAKMVKISCNKIEWIVDDIYIKDVAIWMHGEATSESLEYAEALIECAESKEQLDWALNHIDLEEWDKWQKVQDIIFDVPGQVLSYTQAMIIYDRMSSYGIDIMEIPDRDERLEKQTL